MQKASGIWTSAEPAAASPLRRAVSDTREDLEKECPWFVYIGLLFDLEDIGFQLFPGFRQGLAPCGKQDQKKADGDMDGTRERVSQAGRLSRIDSKTITTAPMSPVGRYRLPPNAA